MKHRGMKILAMLLSFVLVLSLLPGMSLTAYAAETSESFTTNQQMYTYTGEHFTISCQNRGDVDGFHLSTNHSATISARNGETITKVEFTKGWYDIIYLRSATGDVTYSGDVATVSNVNATSLTVNASSYLQIKAVTVYYSSGYNVTITGGANAATSGGETSQTGLTGAMTTVTYTANNGYTFPAFSNSTTNGVTLTRVSDTVVTVSGTPTANVNITVPDAAAIPTYTVTYKVINGTWSDGSTADKTETVASGAKPANVPTGMIPSAGYTGGAWSTNPATATITGATTFTYTFGAIPTFTVTYEANNGSGETRTDGPYDAGTTYTVEGCSFAAPEGKEFDCWQGSDGKTYKVGAPVVLNANLTLTAQWKDKADGGSGDKKTGGSGSGFDIVFNIPGAAEDWGYAPGYAPQRAYRVSLAPMVNGSAALGIMTGESTTTEMNVYPTTTIYVFPNANPGFVLDKIIWSLIDGSASYDITETKNFVMPAMDAVVYVTFKPVG